jgi:flagellar biosynthetic protein FliR
VNALVPDFLQTAFAPEHWVAFVLITARVGGFLFTAPGFSGSMIPGMVRTAVTVVLAVFLLPGAPSMPLSNELLDLPLPLAGELMIGMILGLMAAVIVQALGHAGEVISMQMGLSIAPALSPVPEMQVVGLGQITSMLAVLIYFGLGGHLMLLRGLSESLRLLPPGGGLALDAGAETATRLAGQLFVCAVSAAAPVMVALLLTNIAMAILGRAVPQMNAMMMSFPITIGIGLLTFSLSLPILSAAVARWIQALPAGVADLLEHLRI